MSAAAPRIVNGVGLEGSSGGCAKDHLEAAIAPACLREQVDFEGCHRELIALHGL